MFSYQLEFPPSANSSWRAIGRGRVIMSARYRDYRAGVIDALRGCETLTGRLSVSITLHAPTRRKYDIDNRIKPLLDSLEHAGAFLDDEQIDKITVERGEVWPRIGGALVWVHEVIT